MRIAPGTHALALLPPPHMCPACGCILWHSADPEAAFHNPLSFRQRARLTDGRSERRGGKHPCQTIGTLMAAVEMRKIDWGNKRGDTTRPK